MGKPLANIFEHGIDQGNHSPGDAISLGPYAEKVTIKNQSNSGADLYIGINTQASTINLLQPGESATYERDGLLLTDKNGRGLKLYLAFDENATNGLALVSVISDSGKEDCK